MPQIIHELSFQENFLDLRKQARAQVSAIGALLAHNPHFNPSSLKQERQMPRDIPERETVWQDFSTGEYETQILTNGGVCRNNRDWESLRLIWTFEYVPDIDIVLNIHLELDRLEHHRLSPNKNLLNGYLDL
jgi:hypothetical protein